MGTISNQRKQKRGLNTNTSEQHPTSRENMEVPLEGIPGNPPKAQSIQPPKYTQGSLYPLLFQASSSQGRPTTASTPHTRPTPASGQSGDPELKDLGCKKGEEVQVLPRPSETFSLPLPLSPSELSTASFQKELEPKLFSKDWHKHSSVPSSQSRSPSASPGDYKESPGSFASSAPFPFQTRSGGDPRIQSKMSLARSLSSLCLHVKTERTLPLQKIRKQQRNKILRNGISLFIVFAWYLALILKPFLS